MKILTKEDLDYNKEVLFEVITNGTPFIHPTDTIYGLGCSAQDPRAVKHLRDIKGRQQNPFSIIAPSKSWIKNHCHVTPEVEKWLEKLPGPYTLILKCNGGVAPNVAPGIETLGIRIPDHWFSSFVEELGIPIVTTSANKAGGDFMTSLDNLDDGVSNHVEFIVFEGEKHGRPSTLVDLTGKSAKVIER